MKSCKLLARPLLSYGKGAWIIRKQDEWHLTSAEMEFLRKNVGYFLLVHRRNELITGELKKTPASEYLQGSEEI